MAHDVFIAYSKHDRTVADAAVAVLESRGIRCWMAPRNATPGLDWSAEIIGAIESAAIMVLIFSGHANESPQVKREVERAVNRGIPLIPFRLENVELSKSLEYFISSPHWLDALTPPLEKHLQYLADSIQLLLDRAGGRQGSEQLRNRIDRRRRLEELKRRIKTGALVAVGIAVIAAGAWAWGRFGGGATANEMPAETPASATQPGPVAAPAAAPPSRSDAVDAALVGNWENNTIAGGLPLSSTFVVTQTGSYRFDIMVSDSGRFAWHPPGTFYLVPANGGRVDLRVDNIDAEKAVLTGPLGTQEWTRVGFPTNTRNLIVGEWRSTLMKDGVPWQQTFTLQERGWQYRLISKTADEGTIEARGGNWTTRSRMNNLVTNGTYQITGDRTMSFTGPLGPAVWTRQR